MSRLMRAAVLCLALAALAAPSTAAADNYVALGDSYSSGVGTNSYTLSSSCLRGVYAYPYLVSQQRPNTSLNFVACSGATTTSLMSSQIQAVNASTNAVSVTIGGNDIGFSSLILQCTLGSCSSALNNTRAGLNTSLAPKLNTVYSAIKAQASPTAKVVVLGYPRLFSTLELPGHDRHQRAGAQRREPACRRGRQRHRCPRGGLRVHVQERDRLVDGPRGLLEQRLAQRSEHLQHDRELPPQPQRQQPGLRAAGTPGHRLI